MINFCPVKPILFTVGICLATLNQEGDSPATKIFKNTICATAVASTLGLLGAGTYKCFNPSPVEEASVDGQKVEIAGNLMELMEGSFSN